MIPEGHLSCFVFTHCVFGILIYQSKHYFSKSGIKLRSFPLYEFTSDDLLRKQVKKQRVKTGVHFPSSFFRLGLKTSLKMIQIDYMANANGQHFRYERLFYKVHSAQRKSFYLGFFIFICRKKSNRNTVFPTRRVFLLCLCAISIPRFIVLAFCGRE